MKILLCSLLAFTLCFGQDQAAPDSVCKELLNYIYKDITLKNMRLSLERLNKKMMLGFAASLANSEREGVNLSKDRELLSLLESMREIDPDFEDYLQKNRPYRSYRFWNFFTFSRVKPDKISYQDIVSKWKELQTSRPELFRGLEERYLLDEWDEKTSELLQNYSSLNISDSDLSRDIASLSERYEKNLQDIVKGSDGDYIQALQDTKKDVDSLHESFNKSSQELFWQSLDDYQDICSLESMNQMLSADTLSCPYVEDESAKSYLSKNLRDISNVLSSDFLNENDSPPIKPTPPAAPGDSEPSESKELIKIHPYDYQNINYAGNFCVRDTKLADTVVIHHSGTDNRDTPQELNDNQVIMHENDRDSAGNPDPWYMLAYNYVVKASYDEGSSDKPKVYTGRPDHIKGAHAGAYVNLNQVDPKVRKLVKEADIKCGWNSDRDKEHSIDRVAEGPTNLTKRQIQNGYVSANITSVGVLVVGNYAPDIIGRSINPDGYPSNGPVRYPTDDALRTSAKLICQLKSDKYPNLRKITDHNYIKIKKAMADGSGTYGTCCPGTVYRRMDRMLELTKEECPEHTFALDISPEDKICSFLKAL